LIQKPMKYFVLIILFFAAVSFAQVGKYTHIVGGSFTQAGQRLASGFGCWDTRANRYGNLPRASFMNGAAPTVVSDIAPAGRGFLAVGDFTSVNGINANGIAFFDGSKWCAFPHLNLYTYDVPNPSAVTNPIQFPNRRANRPGFAVAIAQLQGNPNDFYIFGGRRLADNRPAFNQVGTETTGVAGLVRLTFDANTNNFTIGKVPGYETRPGQFTGNPLNDGNGYPADTAPIGTIGRTKVRVVSSNSILSFYVHPNVGAAGSIQRWRTNTGSVDSQWISVQTPVTNGGFNVSNANVQYNVVAQGLQDVARDFDHDGTNLFIVGQFDNSANTTSNVNYVNVACSPNANTNSITWQVAANWPNVNNFNQTITQLITVPNGNLGAFRIATEPGVTGVYYVATAFVSVDTTAGADRDLFNVPQYFIYRVNNAVPTLLGTQATGSIVPRFDVTGGGYPTFARLSFYNSRLYVFGDFAYYSWINNQNNQWPRHYQRCISNAVFYDGSEFVDAYGGFTGVGANYPLIAANTAASADFVFVAGATNYYDIFSAGSVVAYNRDTKRWVNFGANRFVVRGTNTGAGNRYTGMDGNVQAIHFIKKQRSGISDAVVVGGQFDWYGNQYLGSVAYLRTNNGQYESLGGGLFVEETSASYTADQTTPIYRAGNVLDFEEIDGRFYAAGAFTKNINGACLNYVASVSATNTGEVWTSLGAGCDGVVRDLIAKGNDLYLGGDFNSCAGVDGTRRVARYDTKKGTWWALQEGLEGQVYAMIWYRGNLLVGGSFTANPAAYRSTTTGLWEWNGNRWAPLAARCYKDCADGLTNFNFPFAGAADPASRSVVDVRSLRTIGGNLYIHGTVLSTGVAGVLIQYDGKSFKQYGTASNACTKQGCLASNNSEVIALFNRPNGLNQNYMQYNPDRQNWVDTFTGFNNQPIIVASASSVAMSLFSLILIIVLAF